MTLDLQSLVKIKLSVALRYPWSFVSREKQGKNNPIRQQQIKGMFQQLIFYKSDSSWLLQWSQSHLCILKSSFCLILFFPLNKTLTCSTTIFFNIDSVAAATFLFNEGRWGWKLSLTIGSCFEIHFHAIQIIPSSSVGAANIRRIKICQMVIRQSEKQRLCMDDRGSSK